MTTDVTARQRTTYREVFAVHEFRVLFVDQVLVASGITLQILALSVLIYARTGSALLSAAAFGAGFLPQALGGATLTALADRVRPRPLIAAGNLLQGGVAAVLALAPLPAGGQIGLVAAAASLQPLFRAGRGALLPDLLSGDTYVLGRSVFNLSASGAQLAGLGLGGAALTALGPRAALLGTAGVYLLGALVVRAGLADRRPRASSVPARQVVGASWHGNVALLAHRRVRRLLLLQWLPVSLVVGAEGLIVTYVGERGGQSGTAGWLLAALPAGMLVGDALVGRLCRPATRERLVLPLLMLLGLPLLVFAAEPPFVVAGAALGVASAGFSYALGLQRRFVDAVPEDARGQAFGLLGTGLMSGQGLGPVICGAVAGFIGAAPTMAAAGAAVVLSAILLRPGRPRT